MSINAMPKPESGGEPNYEERLWARADKNASEIEAVEAERDRLYAEVVAARDKLLSLGEQDGLVKKEARYFELDAKLRELNGLEGRIEQALIDISNGKINAQELDELAPPIPTKKLTLSKRRRAILEAQEKEKRRLGKKADDPDMFIDPFAQPTSIPGRLTTGGHASHIKGSINPQDAEGLFYNKTADTHGGKVAQGKKTGYYTSKSGRRIRKK